MQWLEFKLFSLESATWEAPGQGVEKPGKGPLDQTDGDSTSCYFSHGCDQTRSL